MIHRYQISQEGLDAINDYIKTERMINHIWDSVAELADVEGRTPHSARHAMGRHVIEKTGNIAAVQRQLGHKNAAYSMQYARITEEELNQVLDER